MCAACFCASLLFVNFFQPTGRQEYFLIKTSHAYKISAQNSYDDGGWATSSMCGVGTYNLLQRLTRPQLESKCRWGRRTSALDEEDFHGLGELLEEILLFSFQQPVGGSSFPKQVAHTNKTKILSRNVY